MPYPVKRCSTIHGTDKGTYGCGISLWNIKQVPNQIPFHNKNVVHNGGAYEYQTADMKGHNLARFMIDWSGNTINWYVIINCEPNENVQNFMSHHNQVTVESYKINLDKSEDNQPKSMLGIDSLVRIEDLLDNGKRLIVDRLTC